MKTTKPFLLTTALLALGALGCEIEEPCDKDQTVEYGLCVPPEPGGGGSGAGGSDPVECEELPDGEGPVNTGVACTEGGTECTGGTVCGAPEFPQCVAACGVCDFFFESCPDSTSCTEFPQGSVCL